MPDAADLFGAALEERLAKEAPLASRMRPTSLDDVVGQEHLVGPGGPLRALIETGTLSSLVLWGPPGSGKTTIARLIADHTGSESGGPPRAVGPGGSPTSAGALRGGSVPRTPTSGRPRHPPAVFITLSATSSGVKEVREVISGARARLAEESRRTILFLDEIHRFTKAQQDALLPGVEQGIIILVGATTENPFFELTSPLLSRSLLYRLEPLSSEHLRVIAEKALRVLHVNAAEEALAHLIDRSGGDARSLLNSLEVAAALAAARGGAEVGVADAEEALQFRRVPADRAGDTHYDQISAFIKSLRGSDPDAAIYWLARMLGRGEDPRFIARRMVIFSSEDVGNADPRALLVAVAAFHALEFVGLPEAQLNLAQAAIYLARAPKSNASAAAIWRANADIERLPPEPVPAHLRDASYPAARRLGHGAGYLYPHDFPGHVVDQEYRPPSAAGLRWYVPSGEGEEHDDEGSG